MRPRCPECRHVDVAATFDALTAVYDVRTVLTFTSRGEVRAALGPRGRAVGLDVRAVTIAELNLEELAWCRRPECGFEGSLGEFLGVLPEAPA